MNDEFKRYEGETNPEAANAQWLRKVELVLKDTAGYGVNLSRYKIVFKIKWTSIKTIPNMVVRVYNLSEETMNYVIGEYKTVDLSAGYENGGNYGLIFKGDIKYFNRGRESATDTYLEIYAGDGDRALNNAVVKVPLAAGRTQQDVLDAVMDSLQPYGVTKGYQCQLPDNRLPRGKTMYGRAVDVLDNMCTTTNTTYTMNKGQLEIMPRNAPAPGPTIQLNSRSGLIGRPVQTPEGINAVSLLNPNFRMGGLVQINNKAINKYILPGGIGVSGVYTPFDQFAELDYLARVSDDGVYRILMIEHRGDTKGQDWYSELTCMDNKGEVPIPFVQRGLAAP